MNEHIHDEVLHHEVKALVDLLGCLANSYRMESAGAEELNRHALVHRHDAEEAIKRMDNLGKIIDDVQGELRHVMKLFLRDISVKVDQYTRIDHEEK